VTDHIVTEIDAGVQTIRINRPDKKNALTRAMYAAMADAIVGADANSMVRVSILTGTADSFTSGNDLNDFLAGGATEGESPVQRFLAALLGAKKPLVAAVNGIAVGVGVTMLLHCDLVYAGESATFQLPFVNLGLVPEAASSLLLPGLVGHQRAAELFLLGERFDARRAEAIGIVNAVHADAALSAIVLEQARKLAAKPPTAVRLTKALMRSGSARLAEQMREEGEHFARQLNSAEAREAMLAMLERRKPDFSRFGA
jgi:enoyl-CoA hydratase/carnithine racemase